MKMMTTMNKEILALMNRKQQYASLHPSSKNRKRRTVTGERGNAVKIITQTMTNQFRFWISHWIERNIFID